VSTQELFSDAELKAVKEIASRYKEPASAIMPLLHYVQDLRGHLGEEEMAYIADFLKIPRVRAYEVATYYTMYTIKPRGRHLIQVCRNLSCTLGGAEGIVDFLKEELDVEVEQQLRVSEQAIYSMVGHEFNVNSPKQLSQVLFEELKLKPTKRGKTHYSTNSEVLVQLSLSHKVPREIIKFRELAKIKSTYIEPLVMLSKEGRIHTTFNQASTATGRLSSSNPNIQSIPIRSDLGRKIRKGFVADHGSKIISADYSQIELRLLAHFSGDKNLIKAFAKGEDIHRHTASVVFGVSEEEVDDKQRRMAKVVNYGLIYGMSDYGLAQRFDIAQEEATQFIQSYYDLYPDVANWREQAVTSAEEKGYAKTLFERRRPLPDLHARNYQLREFSKRAAINTPIQGTAADLIKIAMIDVERNLAARKFKSGLLLSIHDELLFEIEQDRVDEAKDIIKQSMEGVVDLNVPIEVSIGVGENWEQAH